MEQRQIPQQALEYLTRCLRHAVSNGQYLTPELLEEAIAEYMPNTRRKPSKYCIKHGQLKAPHGLLVHRCCLPGFRRKRATTLPAYPSGGAQFSGQIGCFTASPPYQQPRMECGCDSPCRGNTAP
jgi:hypothetical protein